MKVARKRLESVDVAVPLHPNAGQYCVKADVCANVINYVARMKVLGKKTLIFYFPVA